MVAAIAWPRQETGKRDTKTRNDEKLRQGLGRKVVENYLTQRK
jgi:hypothetical protein